MSGMWIEELFCVVSVEIARSLVGNDSTTSAFDWRARRSWKQKGCTAWFFIRYRCLGMRLSIFFVCELCAQLLYFSRCILRKSIIGKTCSRKSVQFALIQASLGLSIDPNLPLKWDLQVLISEEIDSQGFVHDEFWLSSFPLNLFRVVI